MSESRGASYDPAGKFTYHTEKLHGEHLLDGEQPYDDHAKKENSLLVDEVLSVGGVIVDDASLEGAPSIVSLKG